MKQTPLYEKHIEHGAKMVDFAGFTMPLVYTSIGEEHRAVRNGVGIFDVSHMGEFIIKGKDALKLIQKVSSNDAAKLTIGQAQYSCMPNDRGGIVDDLIIYRLPEDKCAEGEQAFMLVVNAANIEKDWNWIEQFKNGMEVTMTNISDRSALLAIQGPDALGVLQKLTDVNLSDIKFYHFLKGSIAGIDNVIISATGYTGSGGFELYMANEDAAAIWDQVMKAGSDYNIMPCGLGARDTLRLEMGYCLYGNDIDDTTSPLEAGLGWITKLKKDADFNSRDLFIRQKSEGIKNKLIGIKVHDRRVPRKGYEILDEEGHIIGRVTSGTQSPILGIPIGMGYVKKEFSAPGTRILIKMRKKQIAAEVCKPPFVDVKKG